MKWLDNKGILVDPNNNEFLCVINNIDNFIKCCKRLDINNIGLNKDRIRLHKLSFKAIELLNDKINDIDINNKCSVEIDVGTGLDIKNININIFGDDGIVGFKILTSPIKFD